MMYKPFEGMIDDDKHTSKHSHGSVYLSRLT